MIKLFFLAFLIGVFYSSCNSQDYLKKLEKESIEKHKYDYLPDSIKNQITDKGIIKIAYDSLLTTKLYEYIFLKDLSFDNGKIKLHDTINKMPYQFKKIDYSNGAEDEEYLILETHYYYTKKSFILKGVLNEDKLGQVYINIGIVVQDSINNSICDLKVGDTITKIPKYFKYAYEPIRIELDTSIKNKQPNFGNERCVSIPIKIDKKTGSSYWLRYICDINTRKIIRIEATYLRR